MVPPPPKKKVYIMNGPPGSGKDTHCVALSKKYNFEIITISELLKKYVKDNTNKDDSCGKYAPGLTDEEKNDLENIEKCICNGSLAPDNIVNKIFLKYFKSYSENSEQDQTSESDIPSNGIIINGFPRTYEQALLFKKYKINVTKFINIVVSKETILKRIMNRAKDPVTNINYNLQIVKLIKKKRQGIKLTSEEEELLASQDDSYQNLNDEIIMRLERREDDNESTFNKRYNLYKENEEKIIPLFIDICKNVDGENDINHNFQQICKIIQEEENYA
ncbi:adenylate kinase 2, putative [Plasmodium berghei]|uniref:Adenylate kinase 2, putative n=2 Tax=Plasmodium berghei TaxID=5821 RepID=A0A509AK96_PLABA|nr:adenylate kinase 2, putative [Plasmodium berghei ANKA]CXI25552.1 adenylate kinase 2, putative [Plasmodium berghei]SCM20405.1 adenylate kinase 2, putative [Plasmodium berghei]SCN23998.1 adenylate kinase 2, putative [Plasmodium berghei]SCO59347.1 adenylate kinase 2, putative [Plasmodium berghei]SCO60455.1 adenylate kinase 2, putative [Plasmodium berghei]|eukprot:XP_034420884.1 adenylate kinase 2, putative [Plasmodium berghei ANKA]